MAGALRAIHIPSVTQEAARDLVRAREALRQDLMRARHRVSKLLLRHGRVYPKERGTWTIAHRNWLASQRFDEPAPALAYIDSLASVDGLLARRVVLEQHLSQIAVTPELWPLVARLRAFRGVDTLTALGLVTGSASSSASSGHASSRPGSAWCPASTRALSTSRAVGSPRRAPSTPAACSSRPPGTTRAHRESGRHSVTARTASPRRSSRSRDAPITASTTLTRARQARQPRDRRRRPRARRLHLAAATA